MSHDAIQLQQIVKVADEPAGARQPSYLGRALGKALALFAPGSGAAQAERRSDGLEALDMLGGWKGTRQRL